MAKISVIVPIYGVEKYLSECLESIINQTFKDIEIICIDDGSKDNCPQIIDEYAKKDKRIIAIHKENGGYGAACNVGLNRAVGEYISIIEPDDYIDLKMYEELYDIAQKFDSDIVKSCFYDNLQTKITKRCKKVKWENDKIPQNRSFTIKECPLFLSYHPSIWSCLYKREFLEKNNIRFVEAPGSGWTDNPFQVQTMCLAQKINYTDKAYYYWRRLNEDESDDLKDWTLPFRRSDEIHCWLEKNNINDEKILEALYVREFAYISIVLGKRNYKQNKQKVLSEINKMTARMNDKFILKNRFLEPKYRKRLYRTKYDVNWFANRNLFKRLLKNIKHFRQNICSIRFTCYEKRIVFLGNVWRFDE